MDDLSQTSFRKALELAEGTVSILDRQGKVFTRVWCCYEVCYRARTLHVHTRRQHA